MEFTYIYIKKNIQPTGFSIERRYRRQRISVGGGRFFIDVSSKDIIIT